MTFQKRNTQPHQSQQASQAQMPSYPPKGQDGLNVAYANQPSPQAWPQQAQVPQQPNPLAVIQELEAALHQAQAENLLLQEAPFRDSLLTLLTRIDKHLTNLVKQSEYQSRLLYSIKEKSAEDDDDEEDEGDDESEEERAE